MSADESLLKKRPAFPFENIAVGISLTRENDWMIKEARRLAENCNARLFFIHVGARTPAKDKQLEDLFFRNDVDEKKTQMIWVEGDIVDSLLKVCKLNIIDLLILGAVEKESMVKHYLGSVARSVSRRAKCSVMLMTGEMNTFTPSRKILVNTPPEHPKTIHTLNTAAYICRLSGIKELTVTHEMHSPVMAMAMAENSSAPEVTRMKKEYIETESNRLNKLIKSSDAAKMKLHEKILKGKPGYAVRKYAASKKFDLLVINSPDKNLTLIDRVFAHDAEFLLAELPCNLLIVHSRV